MGRYDDMSTEDFDRYLLAALEKMSASSILAIPGVYEAVSEELNNEVLDAWADDNPEEEPKCPECGSELLPEEIDEGRTYCVDCRP